jgi:hypothetical protein
MTGKIDVHCHTAINGFSMPPITAQIKLTSSTALSEAVAYSKIVLRRLVSLGGRPLS